MEHHGGEDDSSSTTLVRVGILAGDVLLGVVGTAVSAIALLFLTQPIQTVIYNAVYMPAGTTDGTNPRETSSRVGGASLRGISRDRGRPIHASLGA